MTHLVVREAKLPHTERVVPIEAVSEASPDAIQLRSRQEQLHSMEPFVETHYIRERMPDVEGSILFPYSVPQKVVEVPVKEQNIPAGELAVHRGAHVHATDGPVGQIDEFLVEPDTDLVTHLLMREGHLWGKREVAIPVSMIDHTEERTVYLKVAKNQVAALPPIPVHRWWA